MRNAIVQDGSAILRLARISVGLALVAGFALMAAAADKTIDTKEEGGPALATDEPASKKEHPLIPAIAEARKAQEAISQVKDYEAVFSKTEVVRGRPYPHEMRLKHRAEPFSVYLKFIDKAHKDREVIYIEGKNNGKLKAHEGSGFKSLVTVDLAVNGPDALAEGRYPITEIGMLNLVSKLITRWEGESKYGEIEVEYYPEAKIGQTECLAIMATHPVKRKQFNFHKTVLYIDKKTTYPIRLENYDFPSRDGVEPALVEQYQYSNIQVNQGLNDADFDYKNPQYKF